MSCETDTAELIDAEAFEEYLENGGTLSPERRDHYYARALCALQHREKQIAALKAGLPISEVCP